MEIPEEEDVLEKCGRRYLVLFIVEFIVLLLLLPGCFKKEELIDHFWGEDIVGLTTDLADHQEFYGDRLSLAPGVYRINVQTSLEEGQNMFVEMKCDAAYFHSLRGNVAPIFSGDDYMEFRVYALDKVPTAYVQCDFYNVGAEALVRLDIYRTNQGNRIVLFLVLLAFIALDFLAIFRKLILEGRVSKRQQVIFWGMAVGVLLAYFPYLTDYFSIGADTTFHLTRIAQLTNTLKLGPALPVRIQSGWIYDHGYAVSTFYGDLFLLIPAALQMIGFSLMAAYKVFVFILLVATAVIAYHCFYKCIKNEYAALFGSLIHLLTPYHLYTLYSRGAMGESLAMAFLPLVCCGMYLLYTEDVKSADYRKHKWYIVWGVSALLESHLISTELTAVLMLVFCVIFWKKTFRRETFLQLMEATVIVLLINMWFWLPMVYMLGADVYHLQMITSEAIQERGVLFAGILQLLPNKGSAQTGMLNCEPVQVGAGALMLLVVYVLWRIHTRKADKVCSILSGFSFLLLIISTKYFPWNAAMKLPVIGSVVSSIQFPARWMVLANVFVGMFAGFFFLRAKKDGGILLKTAIGVAAVLAIGSVTYHVNDIAIKSSATYLYDGVNMGTISVGNGEYLLEEVPIFALGMYYHDPVAEDGLRWSHYEKKGTDINLSLENTTAETRYLELPLMGYKGYAVNILRSEGQSEPYITEEVGNHGDLRIAVPAGYQGDIMVSYDGFPSFHVAEIVSLVSLAAIMVVYLYGKRKKVQNGNEDSAK